jgi:hypothetical protein
LNGNSLAVAKLLANNGFKGAYAIEGGIEGPAGWLVSLLLFSPIIILLSSLHDSLCSSSQQSNAHQTNCVSLGFK